MTDQVNIFRRVQNHSKCNRACWSTNDRPDDVVWERNGSKDEAQTVLYDPSLRSNGLSPKRRALRSKPTIQRVIAQETGYRYTTVPLHNHYRTVTQPYLYTAVPLHNRTFTQPYRYTTVPLHNRTVTQPYRYTSSSNPSLPLLSSRVKSVQTGFTDGGLLC